MITILYTGGNEVYLQLDVISLFVHFDYFPQTPSIVVYFLISDKNIMFSVAFACLFVFLFVCHSVSLIATLLKKAMIGLQLNFKV